VTGLGPAELVAGAILAALTAYVLLGGADFGGGVWDLLAFGPRSALEVEQGEDALVEYRFNTHKIAHQFCPTCGVEAFAWGEARDGSPTAAVNVRCLDGIDLDTLTRQPWDGANH